MTLLVSSTIPYTPELLIPIITQTRQPPPPPPGEMARIRFHRFRVVRYLQCSLKQEKPTRNLTYTEQHIAASSNPNRFSAPSNQTHHVKSRAITHSIRS